MAWGRQATSHYFNQHHHLEYTGYDVLGFTGLTTHNVSIASSIVQKCFSFVFFFFFFLEIESENAMLHIFQTTKRTSCPEEEKSVGHGSSLSVLKQQKW